MSKQRRRHRSSAERVKGAKVPPAPLTKSAREVIRDNRRRAMITCAIVLGVIVFTILMVLFVAKLFKL